MDEGNTIQEVNKIADRLISLNCSTERPACVDAALYEGQARTQETLRKGKELVDLAEVFHSDSPEVTEAKEEFCKSYHATKSKHDLRVAVGRAKALECLNGQIRFWRMQAAESRPYWNPHLPHWSALDAIKDIFKEEYPKQYEQYIQTTQGSIVETSPTPSARPWMTRVPAIGSMSLDELVQTTYSV
jgi:hypothetical protein